MHGIIPAVLILGVLTVNLELSFTQKFLVASSFAKSQEVTIKMNKEREVKTALNFKLRFKVLAASESNERAAWSVSMVKYMHSKCCKALHRRLKLMHGIIPAVLILGVLTVNLEPLSLDRCYGVASFLGVNSDIT